MLAFIRFNIQKLSYLSILLAWMLVGCEPSQPKPTLTQAPSQQELLKAQVEFELTDLEAKANYVADLPDPTLRTDEKAILQDQIKQITKITEKAQREAAYEELIEQLIVRSQFADAMELTKRISNNTRRDRFLDDIVRLQMHEAMELYQTVPRIEDDVPFEEQAVTSEAIEAAGRIMDPSIRSEALVRIALFLLRMKDRSSAGAIIRQAADSLYKLSDSDPGKAAGLALLSRWLLRNDEPEKALEYCDEARRATDKVTDPAEKTRLLLDLSSLYTLLSQSEQARETGENAAKWVQSVQSPKQKANLLLKLAESLLVVRMKKGQTPIEERLLELKTMVMNVDPILAKHVEESAVKSATSPLTDSAAMPSLDWPDLKNKRNDLLRQIAKLQAWGAPLEHVWETVQDIDPGPNRDSAIIEAINMLITTGNLDDAEAWAEEIADPEKKAKILKKVATGN